jgi:hypothetical protein
MTATLSERLSVEDLIPILGQQIRVNIRMGTGVPLVLCNGIGASLEVLDPLVEQLDPDTTVVRFDVTGTSASPDSPLPYGFPYLAAVLGGLLKSSDWTVRASMSWVCPGAARWPSSSRFRTRDAADV